MAMAAHDTVDSYLAQVPEPARTTLQSLRDLVHELVPECTEHVTYGCPTFKLRGKAFAGFAHFARHNSWFPHSGSTLEQLEDALTGYERTKSSLHFPHDTPLPRGLVELLVRTRIAALPAPKTSDAGRAQARTE